MMLNGTKTYAKDFTVAHHFLFLRDYKWRSHPVYLKGKSDKEWLDIYNLLACFSSRKKKAIILYKEFMDIDLDDEVGEFFSKKNQSSIFGDSDFVEMIKEKCVRKDVSSNCFQRETNTVKFQAAFLSVSTTENSFNNKGFPVLI